MVRRLFRLAFIAATLGTGCNSLFGIHEGTPRPICADANPEEPLIDDMEDGEGSICALGGRYGHWYTVGDGTVDAELTPGIPFDPTPIDEGGRGTSRYAAHFNGSGFMAWGALMGFGLKGTELSTQPFDASTAGGIKFWMKSNAPVQVGFRIPDTVGTRDGGQCVDTVTALNCNNDFAFQITSPRNGWAEYAVPFTALTQPGGSATWTPRLLLGIQFSVPPGAAFDVWVDDIRFYFCPGPDCRPTCTDSAFPVACPVSDRYPAACRRPGTDCAAVVTWCADPFVIDDMEDGDSAICHSGGRQGWWYTVGDGTSADLTPKEGLDFVQTAIPGGRGKSRYAARMTGSGFTDWGAAMGIAPVVGQPYDASNVSGIKFWMKNSEPVLVLLSTVETAPPDQGGQCVDRPGEHNCGDWFSFWITAPSNDWVPHEVPFSAFAQTAGAATWDPSHLLNINFSPQRQTTFDVWVDDLQFYVCSTSPCLPTCADPAFPVSCPGNAHSPAGCARPGTDCATYRIGCLASNTKVAPADGLIATFMGAGGGSDIAGDVFAWSDTSAPTLTTDGTLHITLDAPANSTEQLMLVVDRFQDCVDAAAFTGVQFSISGSVAGCDVGYFTQDSAHLYDNGGPMSRGSHGIGPPGAHPLSATLTAAQITSVPQTVRMPFAALAYGYPDTPIDIAKITGLGWVFFVDPSTSGGTPSCVADLTIDDVRFY